MYLCMKLTNLLQILHQHLHQGGQPFELEPKSKVINGFEEIEMLYQMTQEGRRDNFERGTFCYRESRPLSSKICSGGAMFFTTKVGLY